MLAVVFVAWVAFSTARTGVAASPGFVPPDITAASDIPYPANSVGSGLVSVSVNLTAGGQIQNVQVVRDVPGLTGAVTNAVNTWTFAPGKLDGNAVASTINVQVVFNPGSLQSQNLQIQPGAAIPTPNPPGYIPAQMSQAFYAVYPANSIATGTVVLDLLIDKYSNVKKVIPLRSVPSLTSAATASVKTWTVNPATFKEKKIDSKLIVVFVFQSPAT